jgi:hypothetical protein
VTLNAATTVNAAFTQAPPTVVTGAASTTATTATVAGTVNPNGATVTNCHVEYGTTLAYGSQVPCSPVSPGAGIAAVSVTGTLSGLSAGIVYHYRVVAVNVGGTADGSDQSFTTEAPPAGQPVEKPVEKLVETPVGKPIEKPVGKPVVKSLTRAQLLSRALKQCKKLAKRRQAACVKKAKKKYAPVKRKGRAKRK